MATDAGFWIPSPDKSTLQNLRKAAMEGDWNAAEEIFCSDSNLKTAVLNSTGLTALHVASRCAKSRFVVKLVRILDPSDLMIVDQQGRTALHYAASSASVEAAKAMVNKESELVQLEDIDGYTPLFYAATWRCASKAKEMVEFLHALTDRNHVYKPKSAFNLIVAITTSGCHALALKDLQYHPELATAINDSGWSILHVIASQPSSLLLSAANKSSTYSRSSISSWMMNIVCQQNNDDGRDSVKLIHFVCKELLHKPYAEAMEYFLESHHPDVLLHTAAKNGAYELVKISLSYFPELLWYSSGKDGKMLLHVAVEYRQEQIFNHIMGLIGGNIESYSKIHAGTEAPENILHLTAKLAPTYHLHSVFGPVFHMQNELQWFKAVESLVYTDEKVEKNEKGMTPLEHFFAERKDLIKNAKEWIKDTSNSCMVIATLVAAVAFASMVTVPGGTNDETGLPINSNRVQFMIFLGFNYTSMIFSAFALFEFLSIQTSRYIERDFMMSLPNSLLLGFLFLFIAVASLMIAFSMAYELAFKRSSNFPFTIFACIPILLSLFRTQIPLLLQIVVSRFGPNSSSLIKDQIKKPIARRRLNVHP